jgi:Thioredoxin domain
MALASPQITAVCVEANEFPQISNQFRVRGVPHTVINRRASFVGALPEADFVAAVLEGAGVPVEDEGNLHPDPPPQAGEGVEGEINYSAR